jgi:predicted phage-related endonuclease
MKTITASNKTEMERKAELYLSLTEQKRKIEKQIKELKDEFLKTLFENEISEEETKYVADLEKIVLELDLVATTRFDTKSFKEEHPKYYQKFSKPAINKVFKAKLK